jgi:5-dehydro-4-deoxyglucarate dehydratase
MGKLTRRSFLKGINLVSAGIILGESSQGQSKPPRALRRSMGELSEALRGVHNFMITPFRANYDLDAEGLRNNVTYHAEAGTQHMTIVAGGGLGELFTLDPEEQKSMAIAAVTGAQGKVRVVVGAGGGYKLALRMARNAEDAGADAILLFAPPYGNESAQGVYEYFRDVARSVHLGVLLYPRGQEDYWPDVIRRLSELPNVIGFKDPSGGVSVGKALGPLIHDRLLWIAEGETHALQALPAGAGAYTSAVATFVPKACREFWKQGVSGNTDRMNEVLKARIEPMAKVRSVKPGYGASGIKVALEALGRAGGVVRPPGTQVLAEDRPTIAKIARNHAEGQSGVSRKS